MARPRKVNCRRCGAGPFGWRYTQPLGWRLYAGPNLHSCGVGKKAVNIPQDIKGVRPLTAGAFPAEVWQRYPAEVDGMEVGWMMRGPEFEFVGVNL